jgi:hypothetical protein
MNNLPQIRELIAPLLWDSIRNPDFYIGLMQKSLRSASEQRILNAMYIKLLNFNRWHAIVRTIDAETLKNEVLSEEVIRGLFPRSLREKYRYVRRVLFVSV